MLIPTVWLFLLTGYSIPKPTMIKALRWITYINVSPCCPWRKKSFSFNSSPFDMGKLLLLCCHPRMGFYWTAFYSFEAILTNEFHTLNGTCSNLVPAGPTYENVTLANQVCTVVGSLPGQIFVDGNRFAELAYGFNHSNTWRVCPIFYSILFYCKFQSHLWYRISVLLSFSVLCLS